MFINAPVGMMNPAGRLRAGSPAVGMARLSLEFGKESEGIFGGALVNREYLGFLGKLSPYKQMCR